MRWRFSDWGVISLIVGIVVILWVILFPLGAKNKIEEINTFIVEGTPSLVRMDMINQGLFFRSNLISGYRGLYQPLAGFISEHIDGEQFQPNSHEFAVSLNEKPEVLSSFLFDKSGIIKQINRDKVTDEELEKSFQSVVEQWKNNELSNLYFGGHARLNYINDSLGGLLLFPVRDGKAIGDTAVGLVFDPSWFIERLPSLIDSLRTESTMFSLYSKPHNKEKYDFGFGAIAGKDTVYWWGDSPGFDSADPYCRDMLHEFSTIPAPHVRVSVIFGERRWYNTVLESVTAVQKFFTINLIGLMVIIVVLTLMVVVYFRAFRHQRSLLAHYRYILKMPVFRIGVLVESIKDKRYDSPQQEEEILEQLQAESDNLQRAAKTTIAAMKKKLVTTLREETDLCTELRKTAERWRMSIEAKGLNYIVDLAESGWHGKWNVDSIAMALDNLIDNALKYSLEDEAKRIVVKGNQQNHRIVIKVIDYGIGIPVQFRRRLFKPFFIIPDDTHRFAAGAGLGLYQAKKAVRANRGRIYMQPNPDGGSVFRIELPV